MAWLLPLAPGTVSSRFGTEDGSREGKSSGSTAHSPSPCNTASAAEHNRNAYLPLPLVSRHRSLVGVSQSERRSGRRSRGSWGAGAQALALLSISKQPQQFPALCGLEDLFFVSGLCSTIQTPCTFLQTPLPTLIPLLLLLLQTTPHATPTPN